MWSLKTRLTAVLVSLCLLACGVWLLHSKSKQYGMRQVQSFLDQEKAKQALQMVRQIDAMTAQIQEAQNHARQRETLIRQDAAVARAAVGGLRKQLEAARTELSTASAYSIREYATTTSNLFAECAGAYQELAEKADGHASDTLMLIQAWPSRKSPQ